MTKRTISKQPGQTPELMIGAISRLLRDGEWVAAGTLSPLPAEAALLAKRTHAPYLTTLIYGDPDFRLSEGFHELFALAQRGKIDVFFLSGVQIDKRGSINLSMLGDYDRPPVRLPGGAGSSMLSALVSRVIMFTTAHNGRLFVPNVDFVNATATDDAPWRRGGLSHVVTPLCVMAFDGAKKEIILASLFPGVALEEVVRNTGFDLAIGERSIPIMDPLTEEELAEPRGPVQERMRRIYPRFAASVWGP